MEEDYSILLYKPVSENSDNYYKIEANEFLAGFSNKV